MFTKDGHSVLIRSVMNEDPESEIFTVFKASIGVTKMILFINLKTP